MTVIIKERKSILSSGATYSRGSDTATTVYLDEVRTASQLLAHGFEHLRDTVADATDCMASSAAMTPDVTVTT